MAAITIQKVYSKISMIEQRLAKLENRLIPEIKVSKKELAQLAKIRKEIKKGNFASEKELFSALS